jgi:transposase
MTKTGNRHVRRLLIEAAWHDFHGLTMAEGDLLRHREEVSADVVAIADRALRRLRSKCHKLPLKQKPLIRIVTALARELIGFVWAVARVCPSALDGAPRRNRGSSDGREILAPLLSIICPPLETLACICSTP